MSTMGMSVRDIGTRVVLCAMAFSLALLLVGFIIGFHADLSSGTRKLPTAGPEPLPWTLIWGRILAVNVPALCLAFSGVVTAGISTLIAWPLTSIYIGATMRTAFTELGVWEAIGATWIYAPWEFTALLMAGGAGLLPLTAATHAALWGTETPGLVQQYLRTVPAALKIFCAAGALLLLAALIEAFVITSRGIAI